MLLWGVGKSEYMIIIIIPVILLILYLWDINRGYSKKIKALEEAVRIRNGYIDLYQNRIKLLDPKATFSLSKKDFELPYKC